MAVKNDITVDISCLWETLMVSDEVGKTEKGGLRRLALSDDDARIRQIFIDWRGDAGCPIKINPVGNIFAERAGSDPLAKPVPVDSHRDTQFHGGRFDGILGVLAGLEVIRTI